MKILFLQWDSFGNEYMQSSFRQYECEVTCFAWPYGTEPMRENLLLENKLYTYMQNESFHFVFSFNFFPIAAKICHELGTKYVSWIYDSPYLLLYSKHAEYVTNHIYIFDKSVCRMCWERGMTNVFYLPMAAPTNYYDSLSAVAHEEKYRAEVSFVGSTYQEQRNDFFKYLSKCDNYTKGYLDALVYAQKETEGVFLLEEGLSEQVLEALRRVCPINKGADEWESDAWIYANYFLARRVTGLQRTEILQKLGERHELKLYTSEETGDISGNRSLNMGGVTNCGPIDYVSEMPLVFKQSKINLNITLKSIHTGIPLRAMDIMACGGFLLTNIQEDFSDFFEEGVDYVAYTDTDDLLIKVDYYLSHEEKRREIAANGYRKMQESHTYLHRAKTILQDVMTPDERELNDAVIELEQLRKKQGGCWYEYNVDWKILNGTELQKAANRQMQWMEAEQPLLQRCRKQLLLLVNQALEEHTLDAYERIDAYFRKNIINRLFVPYADIFYVYIFILLYRIEKESGKDITLNRYTNTEQFGKVYRRVTFLLRRIECGLGEVKELADYMKKEHLTVDAISLFYRTNRCLYSD